MGSIEGSGRKTVGDGLADGRPRYSVGVSDEPEANLLRSIAGAAIGALAGAGIWFGIAMGLDVQFGYVAALVGAMAGWGAVLAGKTRSPAVGLIAAMAGMLGVIGGSYANYYAVIHGKKVRSAFSKSFHTTLAGNPDATGLSEAEKADLCEKAFQEAIRGPEMSYIRLYENNPRDILSLALFAGLGVYYGFRVGAGIGRSG